MQCARRRIHWRSGRRFSTATWNSPILTFNLKAAVENEKLVRDFVQFDVYVEGYGPIAFWGKSRDLIIPYETPEAHVEFAKTWINTCTTFHRDCGRVNELNLPIRLLEVSQANGSSDLKLCEADGAHGSCVALTYCWGEAWAFQERLLPSRILSFLS